ncbi:hypothetical protein [Sphaerochaeta halotolerans]|uniref:Uncharacterized protein n=1 Tax=Sphaerochaeta halotolerans TaxID=2293840 RepID=A0A372MHS1_9SPIR|nr:hypothetical protein [Sphaerochaeta halotolerans]MXI85736.1 hypothetical protein [Sphaerochaeta halotolerans]RFU95315.1 hypothetical protein DYP60_04665 [Sphaerochaeta halotolerans]
MRRTGLLLMILGVLLFVGCAHDPSTAYYGLFEDEAAIIAFEAGDTLFMVVLPWSLISKHAEQTDCSPAEVLQELGGMEPQLVVEGEGRELVRIRDLLTTLAVDTTDRTLREVDGQARLEALKAGAPYLRKTGLADTLSHTCPGLDAFSLLQQIEQFRVYDLRSVFKEDTVVDWQQLKSHMTLYLKQIRNTR